MKELIKDYLVDKFEKIGHKELFPDSIRDILDHEDYSSIHIGYTYLNTSSSNVEKEITIVSEYVKYSELLVFLHRRLIVMEQPVEVIVDGKSYTKPPCTTETLETLGDEG